MHALLRAAFPGIVLYSDAAQSAAERFDFQCALTSLPLHVGTLLETVPSAVPYLKADTEKIAHWRQRIGPKGFKIGICWQGNPSASVDVRRSMPLAEFAILASVPGTRLISLQKNDGLEQIERLGAEIKLETLGENFDSGPDSFIDTMAVMECVDLVISPDTSIAHVAGALARAGVGGAEARARLALDAGSRRQPLVSDRAPVPPGQARRLERGLRTHAPRASQSVRLKSFGSPCGARFSA